MPPIAIFYHSRFYLGDPPELLLPAVQIVAEQIEAMERTGLLAAAKEMIAGVNGGEESHDVARLLLPAKANLVFHGLESQGENLTIVELERWAPAHPGWLVLYLHSKGASHPPDSDYGNNVSAPWRRSMMEDLVGHWQTAVQWLNEGADVVCSHWLWNMADGSQHIPAGNFLWTKASFVATLPSIYRRERIKTSGIAALESRYEAEVYWGNGPRPNVRQFRPNGGGGVP